MWLLAWKIVLQVLAVGTMVLVNLLDYVNRDKRTRRFKLIRRILFTASGIFLIASIIVIVSDHFEDEYRFSRLSQPIQDVYISFSVNVPIEHYALSQYRAKLNTAIDDIKSRAPGGSVKRRQIITTSALFPNQTSEPLAYFLLNFVGLRFQFIKDALYTPLTWIILISRSMLLLL